MPWFGAPTGTSSNVISFTVAPNFTASGFVYNPSGSPAITDHFYLSVGPNPAALTGTITVTQNSATVAGVGTAFTTQLFVGDRLSFNDGVNQLSYTVTAIASDASLTIDRAFADSTATTTSGLPATYDYSPYEGRFYPVTANDASTVTVNLGNDNLTALAAGTQVSIIPYWTLSTIFPDGDANVSYTPTTGRAFSTEIYVPTYASTNPNVTSGTTLAPASIYYYAKTASQTGWRLSSDPSTNHDNDYLQPDGYFTVHNTNGAPTLPITFLGNVVTQPLAVSLISHASKAQDNPLGLARPVDLTVGTLGLVAGTASTSAFRSTTGRAIADELYVYNNNNVTKYTKAPSAIYYYSQTATQTGWRLSSDPSTDRSNDPIPATCALIVHKVAYGTADQVTELVNEPNY